LAVFSAVLFLEFLISTITTEKTGQENITASNQLPEAK